MIAATRNYLRFLARCGRIAFVGDWRYYVWMGVLTAIALLGLNAYCKQLVNGLIVTGMSDEVSWGVYIANFTFLVGVAAAAVMMVIPVYIYNNEELHDLVIFGELLAVAAIIMCLAFVTVDLGRPDRFWHLIPGFPPLREQVPEEAAGESGDQGAQHRGDRRGQACGRTWIGRHGVRSLHVAIGTSCRTIRDRQVPCSAVVQSAGTSDGTASRSGRGCGWP
jgi:hypothetical protein